MNMYMYIPYRKTGRTEFLNFNNKVCRHFSLINQIVIEINARGHILVLD